MYGVKEGCVRVRGDSDRVCVRCDGYNRVKTEW